MNEIFWIIPLMILAIAAGIYFTVSLKQLHLADFKEDIDRELTGYGLVLDRMREPSFSERLTAPFGSVQPVLLIGATPLSLYERIIKKVIFKNRQGATGETWLQISRNRWNNDISIQWYPEPAHFQHLTEDTKF